MYLVRWMWCGARGARNKYQCGCYSGGRFRGWRGGARAAGVASTRDRELSSGTFSEAAQYFAEPAPHFRGSDAHAVRTFNDKITFEQIFFIIYTKSTYSSHVKS